MDEQRTLLGLFRCVFANTYKRFDNVVKSVHIIIEHDQIHEVSRLNSFENVYGFFMLVKWFHKLPFYQ